MPKNLLWVKLNLSLSKYYTSRSSKNILYRFISIFTTFHLVSFAWIFFRAENMEKASGIIHQIINNFQFDLIPIMISSYFKVFIITLLGFTIHWLPSRFKENYRGWFIKSHIIIKVLLASIIIFILYQAKSAEIQPFIYFQF